MINLDVMCSYQNEMETIELRQRKLEELKMKINLDNKRLTERFVAMCDEDVVLVNEDRDFIKIFHSSRELFDYLNRFRSVKYELVDNNKVYLYINGSENYYIEEL